METKHFEHGSVSLIRVRPGERPGFQNPGDERIADDVNRVGVDHPDPKIAILGGLKTADKTAIP